GGTGSPNPRATMMPLRRQTLERQRISRDHMTQRVDEQIRAFPAIEAESHLVQVSHEMLGADLVPRSHDAAFQEGERGFDCVSRDARAVLVSGVFTCQMVDRLMFHVSNSVLVRWETIGDDYVHICAHVLLDVLPQSPALSVFGVEEAQIAVALAKADDNLFRVPSNLRSEAFLLSAHVGFVHFNSTVKHGLVYFFHGSTNAVTEIPCGLIGAFVFSPDRALELHRAHALLGFAQQQYRNKPDRQREMGVVEDRPTGRGELVFTSHTLIASIFFEAGNSRVFAARTDQAFGPAEAFQEFTATVISRVEIVNFRECHDRA